MFLRSSHKETKQSTDQARDFFEPPCNISIPTPQKATEPENAHVTNFGKVTTSHPTEPLWLLETNAVKKSSTTLDIYGNIKEDQEGNIAKKIKLLKICLLKAVKMTMESTKFIITICATVSSV